MRPWRKRVGCGAHRALSVGPSLDEREVAVGHSLEGRRARKGYMDNCTGGAVGGGASRVPSRLGFWDRWRSGLTDVSQPVCATTGYRGVLPRSPL